jgi:hypothetical protein
MAQQGKGMGTTWEQHGMCELALRGTATTTVIFLQNATMLSSLSEKVPKLSANLCCCIDTISL